MKIRIKGDSIRYRLTQRDVKTFGENGYLEEQVNFDNLTFVYALQSNQADKLSAQYKQNKIVLFMPESLIQQWLSTDIVGFDSNDGKLYLLVEKDFTCLDNVAEDQSDNYPNPALL